MARRFAACALPALVVTWAWSQLEDPRHAAGALAVAALALVPALMPRDLRLVAVASATTTVAATWLAFGAQPWELLPYRDEHVFRPTLDDASRGFTDFYAVLLPFDPARNPEMHSLVLAAIFGFTLAVTLLVVFRRPVGAAAVTVAGAGWPATLVDGRTVLIGGLALAAALSIPLFLRARSVPSLAAGAVTALALVAVSAWASSATTIAREAAVNWERWSIHGPRPRGTSVRFAWDANYEGIRFPSEKTVVLTVEGPERAQYWRASTLELFVEDHWFEDLFWLSQVDHDDASLQLDRLTPSRATKHENWLEQRVEVQALVDDHLVAAGTPVALDARRLGSVFLLSGGVLRVRDPLGDGQSYSVWSYAPDPSPAALARSKPRYPSLTGRHLVVSGRRFPGFGTPDRKRLVRELFADPSYAAFRAYERMYSTAERVAGRAATPYAAVLALEEWFRQRGGFVYDEQPPKVKGPPLVGFVTRTRSGYCQQYAGAMAVMLRMLGVPARVAVGFTSGALDGKKWVVTDHEAHAWVEAWFAGIGWVPFDPTPGRGTFAGRYSFASDSEEAVAALRRGDLSGSGRTTGRSLPDSADIVRTGDVAGRRAPSIFAVALILAALWALAVGIGKAGVRRARYLTRDPRRLATASRSELEGFLRDQGAVIPRGATLLTLERAVSDELGLDGGAFAMAAARARFGRPEEAAGGAARARRELRVLLKRARRELTLWARLRGFVSLRSLRGGLSA